MAGITAAVGELVGVYRGAIGDWDGVEDPGERDRLVRLLVAGMGRVGADDERTREEGRAVAQAHRQLAAAHPGLMAEHDRIHAEYRDVLAGYERVVAENGRILAEHDRVVAENARLAADNERRRGWRC